MKHALVVALAGILLGCGLPRRSDERVATPTEAIKSKADLWGQAALKQPGGSSYEFFEKLLPPLRYVDADFNYYPIVLSAPGAAIKGRLVSNGSAINALARQPTWGNETGIPVLIRVGRDRQLFGTDFDKVSGPTLTDGYLPIIHLSYNHDGEIYGQEVFASVDAADPGAILARFDFPSPNHGQIELRFQSGSDYLAGAGHCVRDSSGRVLAVYDDNWEFVKGRSVLLSKVEHPPSAFIMIVTPGTPTAAHTTSGPAPIDTEPGLGASHSSNTSSTQALSPPTTQPVIDEQFYNDQHQQCSQLWQRLIASGTQIRVPEPIVNNAWRNLIVQQYQMIQHDQLNYSAGNQYARQYSNESGDTMRSLLYFNHFAPVRAGMSPLFVYRRNGIELHDGAFKLEDLADYFFMTRDAELIRAMRPLWQREIDLLVSSRQKETGLLPRERYCSDIATPVISLNTNANSWRGLRDMSIVLHEIGETDQAVKLAAIASEYRKVILAAMDKSIFQNVDPPFVPVAMGGEETPPSPITSTRIGSYWNLVIPCVLWSGIFPIDSPPATAIVRYIRENGGLCMGLTRVQSVRASWMNQQNIDDLYLIRYSLALLKRDEADQALVGFYGKLAQGMTRDTFYDGESSGIEPKDKYGREFALPPNSTANASFLIQLRNLLVQDWDMDDDGQADTLRLLFATPRRWMEDGKQITIERAPTAFGEVSAIVKSNLHNSQITADLSLPPRLPQHQFIRFRVPAGWKILGATSAEHPLPQSGPETFDISALHGQCTLQVRVQKE